MNKIAEHQLVSLVKAIPSEGLLEGATGTVVHIYSDGLACEVEFITSVGTKVVTVLLDDVSP